MPESVLWDEDTMVLIDNCFPASVILILRDMYMKWLWFCNIQTYKYIMYKCIHKCIRRTICIWILLSIM